MNLYKKSFILASSFFLFIFSLILIPNNKVDAAVSVSVSAYLTNIAYGGSTTIKWSSSGAVSCIRTDTGQSIGTSGSFNTGALYVTKTFNISCTDNMVYYQLSRCGDHMTSWETTAKPNGSLSTGSIINGATGMFYRVTGSSDSDTSRINIDYTMAPSGYTCY